MIIMGAGINHWFNSDTIYRSILNLVLLCGCQGVNGGGWAHYVGQENVDQLKDGILLHSLKIGKVLTFTKWYKLVLFRYRSMEV